MREDFDGVWFNQHHSEMSLSVDAHGNVSGTYKTKVGAPGEHEKFQLVGFASGDQITFVVDFSKYGSFTAWVGQHFEDPATKDATIYTFWHLSKNVKDEREEDHLWASVLTGSDRFRRTRPNIEPVHLTFRPSNPI